MKVGSVLLVSLMIPKKRFKPKKLLFILLIPLGIIITNFASSSPEFIERYYSNFVYKFIGQVLSRITGVLSFSLAEILILLSVAVFVIMLVRVVYKITSRARDRAYVFKNFIAYILVFISIVYFAFVLLWGLNYYRQPFSSIAGLDVKPATIDELVETTDYIIIQANELRSQVTEDSDGLMTLESTRKEVLTRAHLGYVNISTTYPELSGKYGKPKGVMLSTLMSYTEIWGAYFPFTGEANVNMAIPDPSLPNTVCHEMAHQRGFAREDEANYISYLACKSHPDVDFKYSGTLLALNNLLRAVRSSDNGKYTELYNKCSEGVRRDFAAIDQFCKKYEGKIGDISNDINDIYLKSNKQVDGVKSYGRMVDLLIAEHRARR